ncbi:MAG: hypothetical protein JJU20_04980 [Opitutales bacterium]|nr:hypothetical protein [Opitutales bacterium]
MNKSLSISTFCLFGLLLPFALLFAQEAAPESPLQVQLNAYQFAHGERGQALTEDSEILPGHIIEYELTYVNVSDESLFKVNAEGAIPEDTVYIGGSATAEEGIEPKYSVDGTSFSVLPLIIEEENDAGEVVEVEAGPESFRAIRWEIEELIPGASHTFSYQVQVN